MLTRFGAKDRVSEVRFSSSTGVLWLFGRKMVLNPLPVQLPVKATSGPRGAGVTVTGTPVRSCLTSPIEKLTGEESAVENILVSVAYTSWIVRVAGDGLGR